MGYAGSEEFIRLQFEEYLLALLSAIKYRQFVERHKDDPKALLSEVEGDPAAEFGNDWIDAWMRTENYRIFDKFTDSHLFDIVEPRHPCAGGLTIEDVQRRLAQQVSELHLDERWQSGREVLSRNLAEGQKKVSSAFNSLWADIEVMREAQRKRNEEQKAIVTATGTASSPQTASALNSPKPSRGPDWSQAQASVQAASSRAGAYLSSWSSWASEKRKTGWGRPPGQKQAGPTTANRPSTTTVAELAKEERVVAAKAPEVKTPSGEGEHKFALIEPQNSDSRIKDGLEDSKDIDSGDETVQPSLVTQTQEEETVAEEKRAWENS